VEEARRIAFGLGEVRSCGSLGGWTGKYRGGDWAREMEEDEESIPLLRVLRGLAALVVALRGHVGCVVVFELIVDVSRSKVCIVTSLRQVCDKLKTQSKWSLKIDVVMLAHTKLYRQEACRVTRKLAGESNRSKL
jgi:hypothetical protein